MGCKRGPSQRCTKHARHQQRPQARRAGPGLRDVKHQRARKQHRDTGTQPMAAAVAAAAAEGPAHRLVPKVGSFTGSRIISLLLAMTCGRRRRRQLGGPVRMRRPDAAAEAAAGQRFAQHPPLQHRRRAGRRVLHLPRALIATTIHTPIHIQENVRDSLAGP
jgi:hypothetical protein